MKTTHLIFAICICAMVLLIAPGCVEQESDDSARTTAPPPETTPPSPWTEVNESAQIVAPGDEEALTAELESAMAEALKSAESARQKWIEAEAPEHAQWAIKWSAPLADGGVEYLWVVPASWSAFRVEGRLANPPRQELTCGAQLDDIVSFPVEELADWVFWLDASMAGQRMGGFTIDVMEARFGPPAGMERSQRVDLKPEIQGIPAVEAPAD